MLHHYFSYKIVISKLVTHFRSHRLKAKLNTGVGKGLIKDLMIESSNLTRNKHISFLYYENLLDAKSAPKPSPMKSMKDSHIFFPSDNKRKLERALSKTNLIKSARRVNLPPIVTPQQLETDHGDTSLKEMESIDPNLDPIFTAEDLLHAQNAVDWDQASRRHSVSED
jgi:hypothetical protein